MTGDKITKCPVCDSEKAENLLDFDCGKIDNSNLYRFVKIAGCAECGHIYNHLSFSEKDGLIKYYHNEYAPINIGAIYRTGYMPGGNNQPALKRYSRLYNFISSHIDKNSRILDVGCAMCGFLDYLSEQGLNNLYGIDLTEFFVNHVGKKEKYNIKIGSAESIPFNDGSIDLLVIDQVIEHLSDPKKAFREARRVLVNGGMLCIGVPDASRYNKQGFDFYWFIIREHIQHFDIEHLKILAAMEGFELLDFSKNENIILNGEMTMPNLNVIFRLTGIKSKLNIIKDCFKIKKEIQKYIAKSFEKLNKKRKTIDNLVLSKKPTYVWGISSEFLYLYERAGLKNCNIVGLIDANSYKRKNFLVDGKKIMDNSVLKKAPSNSVLIISAVAYTKQIKSTLLEMGYSGEIISF